MLGQFAAEDCEWCSLCRVLSKVFGTQLEADCADTGIIRTKSRQELLYTRSHIVVTAKAFGLSAIDMVRYTLCGRIATNGHAHGAMVYRSA